MVDERPFEERLYHVDGAIATPATRLSLAEAGLRERRDLQEWVIANPEILGPNIKMVTMEFDRWQSSNGRNADRLDILGLHKSGELVVAELKRDYAPDTVEMQALKYAAMVSRFTIETLAEQHARFLNEHATTDTAIDTEGAAELLRDHADITPESLRRPRVVLLASDYPPTTAATAVWLREMGIDITLMQYRAYRTGSEISISVSQLYPIPSIEDFTISPRQAEIRAAEAGTRKRQFRTVEGIIALAADPAVQGVLRLLVERARVYKLFVKPFVQSLMFTPITKQTVSLFTFWIKGAGVEFWCQPSTFYTYYGIDPIEVEQHLGPTHVRAMSADELAAFSDRLDELMTQRTEANTASDSSPADA